MPEKKTKGASSIIRDAVMLCAITLVAAVLLGLVNEMTKDRIAEQQAQAKAEAYQKVFAEAEEFVFAKEGAEDAQAQVLQEALKGSAKLLAAKGFSSVAINEAGLARDGAGKTIGIVMSITVKGYNTLTMTMGYSLEGKVTGIAFITLSETPGLGMRADEATFKDQFAGKTADVLEVTKAGAVRDNEIEAISSATITSKGVTNGVNAGICFAKELFAPVSVLE